MRLCDKNLKPQGTIKFYRDWTTCHIPLVYQENNKYYSKFKKLIKKFLRENKLKIVSEYHSFKRVNRHKEVSKIRRDFDIYRKAKNFRKRKIELIKINGGKFFPSRP